MDWNVSMWFGQMEHSSLEQLINIMYDSELEGGKDRDRPCSKWLDGAMRGHLT